MIHIDDLEYFVAEVRAKMVNDEKTHPDCIQVEYADWMSYEGDVIANWRVYASSEHTRPRPYGHAVMYFSNYEEAALFAERASQRLKLPVEVI